MWWALILLTLGSIKAQNLLEPMVESPAGLFRGLKADDGQYSMFLGIRYAQVQEGLPFGPAIPQPKIDEVFNATDDSAVCPQKDDFSELVVGTLDCLRLNIFVPNNASAVKKLPVVVWLHGGKFSFGSGNRYVFGPKFIVRHDVLLVTVNYRLGPYGFFCLDIPEVPGNQGIKDQYIALRWIKENIAYFGGDENKITLMGQSAGAASVELHLVSKQEKLFNNAIIQSGTILSSWYLEESNTTALLIIAEHLGFKTDSLYQALCFLTNTDPLTVITATRELSIFPKPCVEKYFGNVEQILTDYPMNLNVPKIRDTPVLAGFNSKEALAVYANEPDEYFYNLTIFSMVKNKFNHFDDYQEMEDIVRHFYIGDESISKAVKSKLIDFESDFKYTYWAQMILNQCLENGVPNVYQYLFSYSGGRNYVKYRQNITDEGAAHADENGYLFDQSYVQETPTAADQLMIDRITTLWTNFAKYGDPTPEVTEIIPVKWTPITKDIYTYLNIDYELTIRRRPFHDRFAFWQLFYELNKKNLIGYREN